MSLVGPPLRLSPTRWRCIRLSNAPSGRYSRADLLLAGDKGEDTTFEEWVEMDLKYIRERSLKTDIKILFLTVRVVLLGKGSM